MKKQDKISYEGQSYPIWFQYELKNDGAIVDIAHIGDVIGIELLLYNQAMPRVKVVEILEHRDKNRTGINYFNPEARFYKVRCERAI